MELILVPTVIGAVELVRRAFKKDWEAAAVIAVAGIVGGAIGYFWLPDVGLAQGVVFGLAASGTITTAQKFGGE